MARYVALRRAPRSWASDEAGWQERPRELVFEQDDTPQDTGLLDQHGVKLYRAADREPIGFRLERKS